MKRLLGIILGIMCFASVGMCFASVGFASTQYWTMTTISPTGSASIECPYGSGELYVYSDAAIDLTIRGANQPVAAGDSIDFNNALFFQGEVIAITGTADVTYQWRKVK